MEGCLAPSEIPGTTNPEWSRFGHVAEKVIQEDYIRRFGLPLFQLYFDDNRPLVFQGFLMQHNPHFKRELLGEYRAILADSALSQHRPDILAHTPAVREFYEIKPDSPSGWRDGMDKVGVLSATFEAFRLGVMNGNPLVTCYQKGMRFNPSDRVVAQLGERLTVTLRARLSGPGLIQYRLCLKSDGVMELITLSAVLGYVVRRLNEQPADQPFRTLDLAPGLRGVSLTDFGTAVGVGAAALAGGLLARAGWRHFWKAVVARFAVRGATAAILAASDGPLPVGDLVAAGLALWTVVDVVRFNKELWREADQIARQGG